MTDDALTQIRAVWERWDTTANIPIWDAMQEIGEILEEAKHNMTETEE